MATPDNSPLVKWRDSPRHERGTYDIITLCASTLVICAWSAVHVDVPRRRTWKSTTGARIFWFLISVFMPELLLMFAVGQFVHAVRMTSYAHTRLGFPEPPSFKQRWKARAKAVALCGRDGDKVKSQDLLRDSDGTLQLPDTEVAVAPQAGTREHAWTLKHSFYALMGGFPRIDPDKLRETKTFNVLNGAADVSVEIIDDRSKAGSLSKAVLCVQIVFFCGNCAARINQHLPLSLLEITTAAHSLCALGAYAVWWYKPQDVGGEAPLRRQMGTLDYLSDAVLAHFFNGTKSDHSKSLDFLVMTTLISVLYGCPHLLGLHVRLATPAERALWLVSTMVMISIPVIVSALAFISVGLNDMGVTKSYIKRVCDMCFMGFGVFSMFVLYPLASAFVVCESIRQLFALPEAAFKQPQWTQYVPHFS